MPKKQFYEYQGRLVLIRYEPKRCIHAEECVRGLPGVFERQRRPWIDPDQGSPQDEVDVVARCPTGALQVERRDGGPDEAEPEQNTVRLVANGPLFLEGNLRLKLADGTTRAEKRMALCRCGDSQNKPYCDNSHQDAGWSDNGTLGAAMMAPASWGPAEPLHLSTATNGPVLFRGPVQIEGAQGAETQKGDKGALCRCGASQKKPYCDGSHVAAGFEAE